MKFKDTVKIIEKNGICLTDGNNKKQATDDDMLIIKLMKGGVTDDNELIKRVARMPGYDEVMAEFILFQFVDDYSDFLAQGESNHIIEV